MISIFGMTAVINSMYSENLFELQKKRNAQSNIKWKVNNGTALLKIWNHNNLSPKKIERKILIY